MSKLFKLFLIVSMVSNRLDTGEQFLWAQFHENLLRQIFGRRKIRHEIFKFTSKFLLKTTQFRALRTKNVLRSKVTYPDYFVSPFVLLPEFSFLGEFQV